MQLLIKEVNEKRSEIQEDNPFHDAKIYSLESEKAQKLESAQSLKKVEAKSLKIVPIKSFDYSYEDAHGNERVKSKLF